MNLLDYVIIILIILSALVGYRKGILSSIISFVGTLIVIVLAFYLKNLISGLMYTYIPFFSFRGSFAGMSTLNILIFEAISYIVTIVLLSLIIGLITSITGVLNRFTDDGNVLTFPSKIGGAIVGIIEGAVLCFVVVFVLSLISPFSAFYNSSKYADTILSKTPVLSEFAKDTYNSVNEIYDIALKNSTKQDKTNANADSLRVLLKYEIITPNSAETLIKNGKISFTGAEEIVEAYKKGDIK